MSSKCLLRAARAAALTAVPRRANHIRTTSLNQSLNQSARRSAVIARAFSTESEPIKEAEVTAETKVEKRGTKTMSFQTETRQILDIVTHSLYTDKEIFLRELISNASDALEKARYLQSNNTQLIDPDLPFEVKIDVDSKNNTITIVDTGIGMNEEELVSHLGTIARSGSKAFMKNIDKAGQSGASASNIIGQFGVGFYSCFMVGDSVEVFTQSAVDSNSPSLHWKSDGTGSYEISEINKQPRGTRIVVHLKNSMSDYAQKQTLEGLIKKYSNFVSFPILLDGERINTVGAIWARSKDSVTEEEHNEFYKYFGNAYDTPMYRYHFSVDAPIAIQALFYIPGSHMEKYGMGRLEPGTSLYSRRVLIQPKCKTILPEFLRFIKGVVDSEDLPLNISRENMQDSRLLQRINAILTKKILKYFEEESRRDPQKYLEFYAEYQSFLKEGACSDFNHKNDIAKLLRFDSSAETANAGRSTVSFDDYIGRMPPTQEKIYYLCAPNRAFALSSPYYEAHKAKGTEVLFCYSNPVDEFVMTHLGEFSGRKLVNVESEASDDTAKADENKDEKVNKDDADFIVGFVKETLVNKVSTVKSSNRLHSSPALIVNTESAQMRKMMRYVEHTTTGDDNALSLPKQKLEINVNHPIFTKVLDRVKAGDEHSLKVAKLVVEQVFDNACVSADLMDNPRVMVDRLNSLMLEALGGANAADTKQ